MNTNDTECALLLAMLKLKPNGMSWPEVACEAALRGSARTLWDELYPLALEVENLETTECRALKDAEQAWKQWTERGNFDIITVLDEHYPAALKSIHEVPPLLFTRGQLKNGETAVSVVGSRDATSEGQRIAANIARGLVDRGITVLSGLAAGIDTAAHRATIDAGGRPVGVIGTGITKVYPAANRGLHDEVARHGALISQFLPDAPPTKHSFPMRNATMSGLGIASVIVEAGEHSGARIQARVAIGHGRPVILTDRVVNATRWGRQMLDRPGVYQASSTAQVMELIDKFAAFASAPGRPVLA
ncbi:hypothetical protein GCM10011591_39730 [Nocardia camponoti]|uniref:Smf/DprA SLOG domain-containing protein n=2 Tax=Nocardia camponoti TaxID=1616106 RepID=A0A917VDC7_9NOCA|nr:hypothetical protein GCM10011591_39730 [Nocardia camponoti]